MIKSQFNPLQSGNLCPFSGNDWETMKKNWNCPDPEFYHCMPNQYNEQGEICVKPNWASKNYCPIFNTAANDIDLIPCDLQYGTCPDIDYRSNTVYQYAGCLNKTHIIGRTTTKSADSEFPVQIIIPVAVALSVLLLLIIVVAVYCHKLKGRKSGAGNFESQPLLDQNDIPLSFRKTVNYLEKKIFYPTKLYEHAYGILLEKGCITLIGPPGSGKTMMAVQFVIQQCGNEGMPQLKFCKTLQQVINLKDAYKYIIIDDWLDHSVYYPSKATEEIQEANEKVNDFFKEYVKTETVQVIFTIQEDKWKAFKHHLSNCDLFYRDKCLSVTEDSFKEEELLNIVKHHFKYWKIKESPTSKEKRTQEEALAAEEMVVKKNTAVDIARNLKRENEFSLPVMIDLICANRRLIWSWALIYENGFTSILKTFLKNWSTDKSRDEKNSFSILMFAALRGGKFTLHDFTSKVVGGIYENVCKEYGSGCLKDIEKINRLLRQNQRLKGCLYQENDVCIFHHDSLLCFVLQFLIENKNANFFLRNVDIEFLLSRCWIKKPIFKLYKDSKEGKMSNEPAGAVIIPKDALKNLAERIHEDVMKGYFIPDWSAHIFMRNETFSKKWKEVHKESATPESASPDSMMEYQSKNVKNVVNITYESTSNEETSKGMVNYADELVTGSDPSPKGHKKNSRQSNDKTNKSKSEDQASNEKLDSISKKTHIKDESTEQQNKISDLIEVNSPRKDVNPNEQAENSKAKKNRSNTKTKPKKQVKNKNECIEETPEQSTSSSDPTIGDTRV